MLISNLYGKQVFTENGMFVGVVVDVFIDTREKRVAALLVETKGSSIFQGQKKLKAIDFGKVISISDIILIRSPTTM